MLKQRRLIIVLLGCCLLLAASIFTLINRSLPYPDGPIPTFLQGKWSNACGRSDGTTFILNNGFIAYNIHDQYSVYYTSKGKPYTINGQPFEVSKEDLEVNSKLQTEIHFTDPIQSIYFRYLPWTSELVEVFPGDSIDLDRSKVASKNLYFQCTKLVDLAQ